MTRITGLATGLDVDTIVKQTMQAYQSKIDTQKQKKDVVEIKQQLYRDIMKEAQELYNKHFDILKEGSLLKSSTWQSVTFKSSKPDLLTVTGSSSSKLANYTVEEGQIAKAAYIKKTSNELADKITINGQEFKVTGANDKEKADNLNKELTKAGINVSVKYTDFANTDPNGDNVSAFVFESKTLGVNSNFVIGEAQLVKGENSKGAEITALNVSDLKKNIINNMAYFKIGEDEFGIDIADGSENSDIESILNNKLSEKGYTVKINDIGDITFITKSTEKIGAAPEISIKKIDDSYEKVDIKSFVNSKEATFAEINIGSLSYSSTEDVGEISINGIYINLKNAVPKDDNNITVEDKITYINKVLKDNNISVTASNKDGNVILKSNTSGENSKIIFSDLNKSDISQGGQDAEIRISNGTGTNTYKGISNTFTLDGVTFKFNGEIPSGGISVTSEQDSSKIVESIKKYIEDYNSVIVKINTLISEKRDRNYEPLTDEQKEEMSDKEIELWEAKVKQGQLRNDSDLTRIANALKQGMKSMVSGNGLTLKSIGIESVLDYGGTKDGTFTIDDAKLKEAIEKNTEEVSKLFTQTTSDTTSNAYNQKGIMTRLKETLYNETVSPKSNLAKKVGIEGTTTALTNTLTKQMEVYQKKIDEMKDLFSDKEQALYNKYSKLEAIMNTYNSQMTYLSQALGLG